MNGKKRILANTIILYVKIVVCTILSLMTVPLALSALGQADYGLFNLIAGVLSMLAFLNASMAGATQRYLSVTKGIGNIQSINNVYNCSIRLHFIIAFFIFAIFEISSIFLFNGILNITPERIEAAQVLYQILVLGTFISVVSVPLDAILFAHENMLLASFIAIIDAVLKLFLVLLLPYIEADKLIIYGIGICATSALNFVVKFIYNKKKYPYYQLKYGFSDKTLFKEMFSYATYNSLGSLAVIARNQGIAIVLNSFCGTVINAAYGIANQINAVLLSFSSSIQTAISPQLMQKEGAKDRSGMLNMSYVLIKLAVAIFSLAAIPVIVEMPFILKMWLKDVPEHTVYFARFILIFQLLSQFSTGVAISIDAVGKIKQYRTLVSLVLMLNIPVVYLLFCMGFPIDFCLVTFSVVEIICLVIRMHFAKKLAGFNVRYFVVKILIPATILYSCIIFVDVLLIEFITESIVRIIFTVILSSIINLAGTYVFLLTNDERKAILIQIKKRIPENYLNKDL